MIDIENYEQYSKKVIEDELASIIRKIKKDSSVLSACNNLEIIDYYKRICNIFSADWKLFLAISQALTDVSNSEEKEVIE